MQGKERGLLAIVLVLICLSWNVVVEAGVLVNPARFTFNLAPGQRDTGLITVTNQTNQQVELLATYYDWGLDQEEKLVTYPSGTLPESLGGLIKFNPRKFALEPGESQVVRFTVTFPKSQGTEQPFEHRGIIFFEHESAPEEQGVGASVKTMIGATVYLMPDVYELAFQLKGAKVDVGQDGRYWAGLLVKNESLVHTRFATDYKIINSQHKMLEEGKLDEKVLLPGMASAIFFPLTEQYPTGDYRLLVNFDFVGVDENMTQAIPFQIKE